MFVYILKCFDNSYYTGVTNNLDRRLAEHNSGINKDCYTYTRRPLELVYHEKFQNPMDAISFEKKVKKWTRRKKESLINENWDELKNLAECKNKTSHKFYNKKKQ